MPVADPVDKTTPKRVALADCSDKECGAPEGGSVETKWLGNRGREQKWSLDYLET